MSYQGIDNGASIRIVDDTGELLIMKRSIQRIQVVREDMIEITTADPFQNIFFRHKDVTAPVTNLALLLREAINGMITNCVCGGSSSSGSSSISEK